jgi:hypothetical protein
MQGDAGTYNCWLMETQPRQLPLLVALKLVRVSVQTQTKTPHF